MRNGTGPPGAGKIIEEREDQANTGLSTFTCIYAVYCVMLEVLKSQISWNNGWEVNDEVVPMQGAWFSSRT